jgi:hypothetical protein
VFIGSVETRNCPYHPLIALRGGGGLEKPAVEKMYAMADLGGFWCNVRPRGVIKRLLVAYLLAGYQTWRPVCFWGPGMVFRLNARRLILVAD